MYSFRMQLDPILANQMADFLADYSITIVNAKEYVLQGESNTVAWEDVGIKRIDDYTIFSLLISIPLDIVLGTIAALRCNMAADHMISFMIVIFISVPSFVFASLLQYLFTFRWPLFPTLYDSTASSFGAMLYSLFLPILALALNPVATIGRTLRGELIETLSSEYLLLARTKGLTRAQATVRHAFRNSLVPIANTIIPMITGIMGILPSNAVIEGGGIRYDGMDLTKVSEGQFHSIRGHRIGLIFQDPLSALNPIMKIGRQITEVLRLSGYGKQEARARMLELMEAVGIPEPEKRFDQYPFQFSGGMRQRIGIADEPVSAYPFRRRGSTCSTT